MDFWLLKLKNKLKSRFYNLLTLIKDSTGTSSISERPALSINTVTHRGSPPWSLTVCITSRAVFPLVMTSSTMMTFLPLTDPKLVLIVPSSLVSWSFQCLCGWKIANDVSTPLISSKKSAITVANGTPLTAIPKTTSASPCERAMSLKAPET